MSSSRSLSPKQMAWLLASSSAIMPFAIDTYLPAVPTMAHNLNVDSAAIQQSLSIFLIGQAVGLLIGGTISDIKGRKIIVLAGLLVFMLSSFALTQIDSIHQLLIMRFAQAIGAGMIASTGGAIVRDHYEGQQAAQMFALIGLIMMVAPLLAPTIGSSLHALFGWRSIFAFLGFYALLCFMLQWKFLPQAKITPSTQQWQQVAKEIVQRYQRVFQTRPALGFLFAQAFSFAAMFCFLTESPFVYMQYFALSEHAYAYLFALNLIAMISFNRITAWRLKKGNPPHQILSWGLALQIVANLSLLLLVCTTTQPPLALFITLVVISVGTQGFISANTSACFMQYFKAEGGSANGVLLSCLALIGSLVGYITTQLHDGSLIIMPLMMTCCTLLGIALLWAFSRQVWQKQTV
ncbi:MAG: multidrug effflux MFS transporter [Acinetobacter sp.]|nr:multidrug effflux MFS transporter [Acinetobacter sp.]